MVSVESLSFGPMAKAMVVLLYLDRKGIHLLDQIRQCHRDKENPWMEIADYTFNEATIPANLVSTDCCRADLERRHRIDIYAPVSSGLGVRM